MQIYIHIPFCEQKCNYCRFASIGKLQNLHIEKYVNFLCEEIKDNKYNPSAFQAAPFNTKGSNVSTIYFGGGTPGVLKLKQFEKILNTIKNKYNLLKTCEISIETTPDKITRENLNGWEKLGINRISMGIQTMNQKSLEEIKRGGKLDIIEALEIISKYIKLGGTQGSPLQNFVGAVPCVCPDKYNKIINISVDFIIGLPYVKKGEILENIKYVLEKYNFIKHLSVYMLEDYYSPDKIIETKYDNITYPEDWEKQGITDEEYLGEYSSIKKYLVNSGFNNYEISNYGKSGFKCKHNIGYWNHSEILGFGMGAYGLYYNNPSPALPLILKEGSKKELIRYANSDNFKDYYASKKLFENKLTTEDIFLEKLMFGLRTFGIEENIYKKLDAKKINYFIENNYLEKKSNKIILLDKGVLVMDYILKEIIL